METLYLRAWKFALAGRDGLDGRQDLALDPWAPAFDDSLWQDVIVPHDWAVTLPFSQDCSSGTGYLPGGTGWYRGVFDVAADTGGDAPGDATRRAFISFDGVYKNSQVWVNGSYLGKRPNGYIGFKYDISHCLKSGRNLVAVKVSHEDLADSRWYTGSGIYRKVFVDIHDSVYVEPDSVVVETEVSGGGALVSLSCSAVNKGRLDAEAAVLGIRLEGKGGEAFAARSSPSAIPAGSALALKLSIQVPSPRLWSADSPELYRLTCELRSRRGGKESCFASKPLAVGIRSIRFDPDKGFFVNGKGEKLRGVCFHHDSGALGAAFWPDVWRRRLTKLKALGCNAVRCSHNPQAPELYDLCDELGLYVMDEAFDEWEGCKNKWYRGHNVYPPVHQGYYEDFPQWHDVDLSDLVIRDRNHPSVILWSIGNEVDYPNDPYVHPLFAEMAGNNDANKPKEEQRYNPDKPGMERLATVAADLVRIVKRQDATRPVLAAAAFPELSASIGFLDSLDVAGYNYKESLYEADHRRFPGLPLLGSENGHSLEAWKAVVDHDFIAGQFLWTGFDFLGEARGWPVRCSGAGILDTAGFEKPGYYRRRTLWDPRPQLYLATGLAPEASGQAPRELQAWELSRSWDYGRGAEVSVILYTNLDSAELFLNGRSLGAKRREASLEYIAWRLPFERGRLEARGGSGAEEIADSLESTLPMACLKLAVWEAPPSPAPRIFQVEIEVLDEEGRLCPTESPLIEVAVSEGMKLLGLENGDIADCSEYRAPRRRAYKGRLLAYAIAPGRLSGSAWIEARTDGLKEVRIEL